MQTAVRHRAMTTRRRHAHYRVRTPAPAPAWWRAECDQARQSTRMLSLAMVVGFASWSALLLALLQWLTR
jgi:hypothetical protein